MIIYGVALLSVSLIFGMLIGEALGVMLGVDANVGGVGIAMLFLVCLLYTSPSPRDMRRSRMPSSA